MYLENTKFIKESVVLQPALRNVSYTSLLRNNVIPSGFLAFKGSFIRIR